MPRRNSKTRVLGLDPGFARTGYAVVERDGPALSVLDYGCLETSPKEEYTRRLMKLAEGIERILRRYRPTEAAMEQLYFMKNVSTAMKVGQARGVLLLILGNHRLLPREFTPQQIKAAAAGYGKAEKPQVQRMMQTLFLLPVLPTPDDAADALAIAYTAASE